MTLARLRGLPSLHRWPKRVGGSFGAMLAEDKFVFQGDGGLATNAADLVKVALIITEQVSAVEHHDPRIPRVALEGRRRPIG